MPRGAISQSASSVALAARHRLAARALDAAELAVEEKLFSSCGRTRCAANVLLMAEAAGWVNSAVKAGIFVAVEHVGVRIAARSRPVFRRERTRLISSPYDCHLRYLASVTVLPDGLCLCAKPRPPLSTSRRQQHAHRLRYGSVVPDLALLSGIWTTFAQQLRAAETSIAIRSLICLRIFQLDKLQAMTWASLT